MQLLANAWLLTAWAFIGYAVWIGIQALRGGSMNADLTYCGICLVNYDDDGFDYRFDEPVCLTCATN